MLARRKVQRWVFAQVYTSASVRQPASANTTLPGPAGGEEPVKVHGDADKRRAVPGKLSPCSERGTAKVCCRGWARRVPAAAAALRLPLLCSPTPTAAQADEKRLITGYPFAITFPFPLHASQSRLKNKEELGTPL